MAFGLPVVTRPVGGVTDFWERGKMGYLIDSFDPDEYVSVISELIDSPDWVRKISKYNNRYAVDNFLASKVVLKFENDIRQYIKNS